MKPEPVAILCSDLHLSLLQPVCRADDNWLDLQRHYLVKLREVAKKLPILCAGDLFDRWNATPELINFAMRWAPEGMITIPGQHDLPNHQLAQIHRSGYGVLAEAVKILDISNGNPYKLRTSCQVHVVGFGWDAPIQPAPDVDGLTVALVHRYLWTNADNRFPDAPVECKLNAHWGELRTYDAVVVGDNHIPWKVTIGDTSVLNCGTFIRRKSDEIPLDPGYGILYEDGSIERRTWDTRIDKFHEDAKEREEVAFNMRDFIDKLEGLGEHGLNFRDAVEQHLKTEDLHKDTKRLILQALETDNKA